MEDTFMGATHVHPSPVLFILLFPAPLIRSIASPLAGWIFLLGISATSCKPTDYTATAPDTLAGRVYCNDPEAVNYNWGFPGRPDNSICRFPTDFFSGTYDYIDSLYFPDGSLDSAGSLMRDTLRLRALDRQRFSLAGFCAGGDTVRLTANRFFRASIDTLLGAGQRFCRVQDTVSGTVVRTLEDTTRLRIFFTVVSDTGTIMHRGTAYRR